jgi:hypothetical protein
MKGWEAKALRPGVIVRHDNGGPRWTVRTYPRRITGQLRALEVGCWNGRRWAILSTKHLQIQEMP